MPDAACFDPTDEGSDREDGAVGDGLPLDLPANAWNPECWWTFGEAADIAGVAHRQLAEWADAGRLTVRTGWREGAEIRLVRAGDVAVLEPAVRARAVPSRVDLEARAVFTGPRRSAIGSGAGDDRTRALGMQHDTVADPEQVGWVKELEREIERLREELEDMRGHRDELLSDLEIIHPTPALTGRRVLGDDRFRLVRADTGMPGPPRLYARWAFLAVAMALIIGVVTGRQWAPGVETSIAASEPAADRPVSDRPVVIEGESMVAGNILEVAVRQQPGSGPAPAPEAVEPDAAASRSEVRPVDLQIALPSHLLEIEGALEPAAAGVPACELGARMRGEPHVRRALGPCFGPLTADGSAVAGSHRVAGTACCSHHAFVERVSSGFTNPTRTAALLAEAAQADRDGLVPPLLVIRAERSAAAFLRASLGRWSSTGLDGQQDLVQPGVSHEWAFAGGAADTELISLELTSWVRLTTDADPRPFRLVLDVTGGPVGDVLCSFDWLGE